jgi:hypothetical protein
VRIAESEKRDREMGRSRDQDISKSKYLELGRQRDKEIG